MTALCASAVIADDSCFKDGRSLLESNPARGAAPGGWHVLRKEGNEAGSPKGFCSWLWNIGAFSGGNEYKGNPRPLGVIGGEDLPLTADARTRLPQSPTRSSTLGRTAPS